MYYWIRFSDRNNACLAADSKEEARLIAKPYGDVTSVERLPYPAGPTLNETAPTFCFTPEDCASRTSCPRRPACSA